MNPFNPLSPEEVAQDITHDDLSKAASQLLRCGKGNRALSDLQAFLQNGAITLDSENQEAVYILLKGVWGQYPGTTLDVISEALEN